MPPSAATAYQSLQAFNGTRQTPDAAISAGDAKYNVSGLGSQLSALRTITGNLQNSIRNVDPSVQGRTSGSLVTEAQRQAITNNEKAPLITQYNDASGNAEHMAGDYQNATGLASKYADSLLQSDQQKYNELFGQYTTLSQQEAEAAKAAEAKREFDLQLADAQAARRAAGSGGGSGLSLGGYGGASAGQPAAPNVQDHLAADIQHIITPDYATRFNSGYTEREITRLQQAYPEIPPATIAAQVYAYRKQFERPAATPANSGGNPLSPGMNAYGGH